MEPICIKLETPIYHGDEEITELWFRRKMVAGDMRGVPMSGSTHDHTYMIIGRLTGIPAPVIKKMEISDYVAANEVLESFLGNTRQTGETL